MVFSSLTFLMFFLLIVLLFYFISKDKYKNLILLVFSLIFYAWGEPKYIILMIISIVVNYFIAILIDKNRNRNVVSKILLILSVLLNIGILFIFKYSDFFIENINKLFNLKMSFLGLILPIGISFYTFQLLSYVLDVYKNKVEVQKNIFDLGTYVALFPQLIAGPIVRYETIEKELRNRVHSLDKVLQGLRRFIIGLAKKVILANNLGFIADHIISKSEIGLYGSLIAWIGMIAYTLQIYYDFSGYSDMAIGLGKIFGFSFLENFNYPYISKSITDFWRRWHISLSSWFKDYVYIPLGGNRVSKLKFIRNIFVVWFLTGFWHGASWNFIIWGLYFGLLLLIEKLFLKRIIDRMPELLKWIYSFILIVIGWTIFRNIELETIASLLSKMFIFEKTNWIQFIRENYEILNYVIFLILGIIGMFPYIGNVISNFENSNNFKRIIINIYIFIIFVVSIGFLVNATYNPFIYFRF